jgi:hypothetical protein
VGGDYITTESGTWLVYTAPGHGLEDFSTSFEDHNKFSSTQNHQVVRGDKNNWQLSNLFHIFECWQTGDQISDFMDYRAAKGTSSRTTSQILNQIHIEDNRFEAEHPGGSLRKGISVAQMTIHFQN